MSKNYGKTQEELDAGKILECRKIVKNIINFGVTEAQKIQLIYLLGLELDSRDSLQIVTNAVKDIRNNDKESNFSLNNDKSAYTHGDINKKILDV